LTSLCLFDIIPGSEEAEQLPESPLVNDVQQEEWEGITRIWYIVASFIVPLLVAWGFGFGFFKITLGEQIMQSTPIVLGVFAVIKGLEAFHTMIDEGLTKIGVDIVDFQKQTPRESLPSPD